MSPHNVYIPSVPDVDLGVLITELQDRGLSPRIVLGPPPPASGADATSQSDGDIAPDLPKTWQLVRELEDQSYAWPRPPRERYSRYRIFAGETKREGTVHIAIGDVERGAAWGRDRKYRILFLSAASPATPLVEFLEVDDYADSNEMIAIIRGSDGGKKMYAPDSQLPRAYADTFDGKIVIYRDRIDYERSWTKLAIVAHEDDLDAMLNHALLQARRRNDLKPKASAER